MLTTTAASNAHLILCSLFDLDNVMYVKQQSRSVVCSGHALLVGVGGSGKQSLARLSGFICGYATYTIVISGNYNLNNFREDLQKMYKRAGVKVSKLMTLSMLVVKLLLVSKVTPSVLLDALHLPLCLKAALGIALDLSMMNSR